MKVIKSKEGMWLTQVNATDKERTFVSEICAPDDYDVEWRDATDEERVEWEQRMDAIIEEEEMNYEQEG